MNKKLGIIFIVSIVVIFFIGNLFNITKNNDIQKDISKKIIRFHVIANSDSIEDQGLKLKVRDEVIKYMAPKLKNSKNIIESKNILKSNDKEVKKIASNVIKSYGYDYNVCTTLDKHNFPIKTYGNITLPQGNYQSYRVIIGEGKGQNWWCVMFPPLCFIDVSKGEIAYKQTEKQMKKVLTKEEFNKINNQKTKQKIKVKFKLVEYLKK